MHCSSPNVCDSINSTAEMPIMGLIPHNTYSYFSNPIVYNTSYIHFKKRSYHVQNNINNHTNHIEPSNHRNGI